MTITKFEHACLVLEESGDTSQGKQSGRLVIDPGSFTKSLTDFAGISVVVITHFHQDHFYKPLVEQILAANPDAKIFSVQPVANELSGQTVQVVKAGDALTSGLFRLKFFGGKHAIIHPSIPQAENVGVMVNDVFYYPGDSFTLPDEAVNVLALPISAPWLKTGESMDFLAAVMPKVAFPTHNGLHNDISEVMSNNTLANFCQSLGVLYRPLAKGEQLEV